MLLTFNCKFLRFWKLLSKSLVSNILSIIMRLIISEKRDTKICSFQHWPRNNRGNRIEYGREKIIDRDFRVLNKSCNSFSLPQISDDHVETLYLEKGTQSHQKSAHETIDDLVTTLLGSLQRISNLPNSIPTFNAIEANLTTWSHTLNLYPS